MPTSLLKRKEHLKRLALAGCPWSKFEERGWIGVPGDFEVTSTTPESILVWALENLCDTPKVIDCLLDLGVDANPLDDFSKTPFFALFASTFSVQDKLHFGDRLIDSGISVSQWSLGTTPLIQAICLHPKILKESVLIQNQYEIFLKKLIASGPGINQMIGMDASPLFIACEVSPTLLPFLVDQGADLFFKSQKGLSLQEMVQREFSLTEEEAAQALSKLDIEYARYEKRDLDSCIPKASAKLKIDPPFRL